MSIDVCVIGYLLIKLNQTFNYKHFIYKNSLYKEY